MSKEQLRKKLVIVGDGEVGKTSLLFVYRSGEFPSDYVPTIFETSVTDVEYNKRHIELELWDTAGQEDFDRLRPLSYHDADVILVCYNIANPDSFINAYEKWIPEVRHFCPVTPIVIVGNKRDLRNDSKTLEKLQQEGTEALTFHDGCMLAEDTESYAYCECSSRLNEGVPEVFHMAVEAIFKYKKKKNKHNKANLCSVM